ncbi:MAG: peptidase M20, partial [Gammaproteobacteria bacterium]
TVNCRLLPQDDSNEVLSKIRGLVGDEIVVTPITNVRKSPASPITDQILELISSSIDVAFPDLPIVPTMSTGATDAIELRSNGVPVYGTSAMMTDPTGYRGHGLNERIEITAFNATLDFWYALMKQL